MNDNTVRGIIFDLDGVIADSHPIHEAAWKALLEEEQREFSPSTAKLIRDGRTRADMLTHLFPEASPDQLAALGTRKESLYYEHGHLLQPVPGVLAWIEKLNEAGLPLALATSASRERADRTLAHFDLTGSFRAVVTASDVFVGKPDPSLFLTAAWLIAIEPEQCLVIEDSPAGVMAAKAAGMRCVLFQPEDAVTDGRSLTPDFIVRDFTASGLELIEELAGLK